MTKYISTYTFMDLLKDKGFVPGTDHVVEKQTLEALPDDTLADRFSDFMTMLSGTINRTVADYDYDFMDLLQDKGHVPALALACDKGAANDNVPVFKVAS